MKQKTKLGIALGTLYVAGAVGATIAVNMTKYKIEVKTKIEVPSIKTELSEQEAIYFYDLLIKNGASASRANLLINEVDNGRLSKQQLQNIIKTWKKDK